MAKTRKTDGLVRSSGGAFMLNQHAPRFAHKTTKRNRSRSDQRRRAIAESA